MFAILAFGIVIGDQIPVIVTPTIYLCGIPSAALFSVAIIIAVSNRFGRGGRKEETENDRSRSG
jgi:hypothetical protein